jgi:hypothetical protein
LIDVATGMQLIDEVGKEPRFSPTGRFVVTNVERKLCKNGVIKALELYATVKRAVLEATRATEHLQAPMVRPQRYGRRLRAAEPRSFSTKSAKSR